MSYYIKWCHNNIQQDIVNSQDVTEPVKTGHVAV